MARVKLSISSSPIRRNIGMTLIRQLLAAFAQFMLVVLIARELGPEGNGFYAMAILLPTLLATFLNLGVGPATVYFVSRGELSVRHALAGNLNIALVISVVGIGAGLVTIAFWRESIFPGVPKALLYLGLISFPLTLLVAYVNTILQGLENFKAFNLTVLIPPYVNLFGVIITIYLLDFGVVGAMVAYIAGQLAGLTLVLTLLRNDSSKFDNQRFEKLSLGSYSRKTLSYGWKAHLSNILSFVNYRADIFLVNLFLTPTSTGLYVIAVQIAEKLWMLSQAASTVLLPRLSAMHKAPEARLALTNRGFWFVAGVTTMVGIMAAGALYWLISPLFGHEFQESWPVFIWLLPGIIAGAGERIQSNCIAAAGKPEWNMYAALVVVSINIVGNLALIPDYGMIGAASATSLAYAISAALKFWLIRKTLNIAST
nr:flippase [Pseudidiomarina sp. 1ASP75-14]